MGSLIPSGSHYWGPHFGIYQESDLRAALAALPTSVNIPFGGLGFLSAWAQLAWTDPFGAAGLAAQVALKAAGYPLPLPTSTDNLLNTVLQGVVNAIGALPVSTLVIPNAFQVTIQGVNGDVAVDNVLGVVNASGSAAGAAAAVKAAWEASGGPADNLNSQYVITQYKSVDLSSASGDIAVLASTKTGGGSGSISTAAACALISWNGSSRSRSTRGRLYYGPLGEGAINPDGRTLDSTVLSDLGGIFTTFRGSLSTAGYPLAVLSRVLETSTLVTAQTVEPVIATQRRRIRGR